jgi:hypothetical protein
LAVAVNSADGHGVAQVVYVGFVEGQVAMGMALLRTTVTEEQCFFFIMTQILVQ